MERIARYSAAALEDAMLRNGVRPGKRIDIRTPELKSSKSRTVVVRRKK
jgi:hypothetical protein